MVKKKIYIDDVILKNPQFVEPCLVQFANGTLKRNSKEGVTASLHRTSGGKNKVRPISSTLNISSPLMKYVGRNLYDCRKSNRHDQLFLGILDKNTGKMTLVEASTFMVHPELQDASKSSATTTSLSKDIIEDRMAEFGGKKARSRIRKRDMNKVDLDTMSFAFENAAAEVVPKDLGDEMQSINFDHMIPPCDREARLIGNVYSLSSIVSDEELMQYADYAHDILDGGFKDDETSLYSMLFAQTLATCKMNFPEEYNTLAKYTCANLYMDSLIYLLKLKSKSKSLSADKLKEICCPPILLNKMLNQFTSGEKKMRVKTIELEDKLVCYIIVLALILNNQEVSLPVLLQSMGIEKARLEKLVKVVGGRIKLKNVILQFPLTQLSVVQKKRKMRR